MSNKNLLIGGVVGLVILGVLGVGGGIWVYNSLLGDALEASGPLTAVPLVVNTAAPATQASVQGSSEQPTAAATAEAGGSGETTASGSAVIFQIVPEQSQASFSIYEDLAGQPNTVVGTTSDVSGQLAINTGDLSQTQVGVIQINARTFVTDSDRRNNAIRNFILNTNQYELITFTPTSLTGLSGSAQVGQPVTFQVVGDLTIRNITQSVTFDVTVTGDSEAQITGKASTIIKRSDYQLSIPNVPNVANVGEELTLEFNFVATAAN